MTPSLDAALEAAGEELRTHLRRARDPDSLADMRPGREVLVLTSSVVSGT
jgi:hypothetical protein